MGWWFRLWPPVWQQLRVGLVRGITEAVWRLVLFARILKHLQHIMIEEEQNCCQRCCPLLGQEFTAQNFSLYHETPTDFYRCQWQRQLKSVWWLIYRWCLAVIFSLGVLGSLATNMSGGKWFIYLTNWGFTFCMFTCVFGAVLTSLYFFKSKFDPAGWVLKLYWASHWSTLILATLISIVFWAFLYPAYDDPSPAGNFNLLAHAFNAFLMLVDHMLVAFPTRLMHFVYPFIPGFTYLFFSLFYYLAGGTDPNGNPYIYPILDWTKPGMASITACFAVLFCCFFCFVYFLLYKLRVCIRRKQNNAIFDVNI